MPVMDTDTTTPDADPAPPVPDEPRDLTQDEMMAECVAVETERRAWLKACRQILAMHTIEQDPEERVQTALDNLFIAAAERAGRILHSDVDGLPDD